MPSMGGGGEANTSLPGSGTGSTFSERCSAVVVVIHGLPVVTEQGSCFPLSTSAGRGVPSAAFCSSSIRSLCSRHAILRSRSSLVTCVVAGFGGPFLPADWADAVPMQSVALARTQPVVAAAIAMRVVALSAPMQLPHTRDIDMTHRLL